MSKSNSEEQMHHIPRKRSVRFHRSIVNLSKDDQRLAGVITSGCPRSIMRRSGGGGSTIYSSDDSEVDDDYFPANQRQQIHDDLHGEKHQLKKSSSVPPGLHGQDKDQEEEESEVGYDCSWNWTRYLWFTSEPSIDTENLVRNVSHSQYLRIHQLLQQGQYIFALGVFIAIISIPELRAFFIQGAWSFKALFFLIECLSFAAWTVYLDLTMPVSYTSFLIIRLIIMLEIQNDWRLKQEDAEKMLLLKASKESNEKDPVSSIWSELYIASQQMYIMIFQADKIPLSEGDDITGSSNSNDKTKEKEFTVQEQVLKHLLLGLVLFMASAIITRFTKFELWRQENLVLLGCFVSSIFGAVIFVTAPMTPERISLEVHGSLCQGWAHVSILFVVFACVFMAQRLIVLYNANDLRSFRQRQRMDNSFRLLLDIMFTFLQIYLVVHYIRVIHPDFSFRKGIPLAGAGWLLNSLPLPNLAESGVLQGVPALFALVKTVMENYYLTLPMSMTAAIK